MTASGFRLPAISTLSRWLGFTSARELGIFVLSLLICGVLGPWFLFLIPCLAFGFLADSAIRPKRMMWTAPCVATACWNISFFVQDVRFGLRLSHRLAGLFSLPSWIIVYILYALTIYVLAWLAVQIGMTAREWLGGYRAAHGSKF